MVSPFSARLNRLQEEIASTRTCDKVGMVRKVTGLIIESEGPETSVGQVCTIISERTKEKIEAQVVGFRDSAVVLMALIAFI